MPESNKGNILFLTIVHPDFLPPVYASAQTLRDEGYSIHILTFDSFVPSDAVLGNNIKVESLGKHHNVPFMERIRLRRKFVARAKELTGNGPRAIIAFCQYSFLYALKIKKNTPVIYHALEMADFIPANFFRSPLNAIANWRALRAVHKADMAATPSMQRSAWLAGRCHLDHIPVTVINSAYIDRNDTNSESRSIFETIVPANISDKKIVLYTGAVNDRLCVFELVQAFDRLNDPEAALVMTGIKDNAYCRQIQDFVAKSHAVKRIVLLPYVTRKEMLSLQYNAHIGVCLSKERPNDAESQMIAPNKVGEYLAKGLFLLGTKSAFMTPLALSGVAEMANTPDPEDIAAALQKALATVENINYKSTVTNFVKEYFCMQAQLRPVIDFLKNKAS